MSKRKFTVQLCVDEVVLKALHKEIFPNDKWCGIKNTIAWVIWEKKIPVGFCMLEEIPNNKSFVNYTRAGILPMYEGNGLHVQMIRTRERYARRAGYMGAVTYTTVDNYGSILNLQKCGYRLYVPRIKYAGKNYLYWRKEL